MLLPGQERNRPGDAGLNAQSPSEQTFQSRTVASFSSYSGRSWRQGSTETRTSARIRAQNIRGELGGNLGLVSGGVKTVEIGRFENRVFGVDGAEVLEGLLIEG